MIKAIDILASLINVIRENLKGIHIESREVKEGYRRKSIYIYLDDTQVSNYMEQYRETETTAKIIYFPERDYNTEELLEIQEKLNEIFADKYCIDVCDISMELKDPSSVISDGVLLFNFDVYVFEEYPKPTAEMMEELYIREV